MIEEWPVFSVALRQKKVVFAELVGTVLKT